MNQINISTLWLGVFFFIATLVICVIEWKDNSIQYSTIALFVENSAFLIAIFLISMRNND